MAVPDVPFKNYPAENLFMVNGAEWQLVPKASSKVQEEAIMNCLRTHHQVFEHIASGAPCLPLKFVTIADLQGIYRAVLASAPRPGERT